MVDTRSKWEDELEGWLESFLDCLGHKARRRKCTLCVSGLIGPGDRKSVQPMATRLAPSDCDQPRSGSRRRVNNIFPVRRRG